MLLEGKKLLVTGVLTPQSIAFAAAEVAQGHRAGRGLVLADDDREPGAGAIG